MAIISFTLHHYKTNEPLLISFRSYGGTSKLNPFYAYSLDEPGIEVQWKDENNELHHAKVRETIDEIDKSFNEALKKSK